MKILLRAVMLFAIGCSPLRAAGDAVDLQKLVQGWIPKGMMIKTVGSYSGNEDRGEGKEPLVQTCDNVESYLLADDPKRFFLKMGDFTSTWLNGRQPTITSTRSIYSDGTTVQDMVQWGKSGDSTKFKPTGAELSNVGSANLVYSPYVNGVAFTAKYLVLNEELRHSLMEAKPDALRFEKSPDGVIVTSDRAFNGNGQSVKEEVRIEIVAGSRLKSSHNSTSVKGFGASDSDTVEEMVVKEWTDLPGGCSFPKEAEFTRTVNGKLKFTATYKGISAELLSAEKFPSVPLIPPRTDLVDKRAGISIRTGEASSSTSSKLKDFTDKAVNAQ